MEECCFYCNSLSLPKFKTFFIGHPDNPHKLHSSNTSIHNFSSADIVNNKKSVSPIGDTTQSISLDHNYCSISPNSDNSQSISLDHNYCSIVNPDKANFLKFNFLSLNVCGLHSKLKYGNFESYIKPFDFICLSETKTNYIAEDEIPGFKAFFSPKKS